LTSATLTRAGAGFAQRALDTGALGHAAAAAGMSYRAAWGLLRGCQERFGADLVVMERGRGTTLTPFGESLLEMDVAARQALGDVHKVWKVGCAIWCCRCWRDMRLRRPPLRLYASHDLALADWAEHGRQVPLESPGAGPRKGWPHSAVANAISPDSTSRRIGRGPTELMVGAMAEAEVARLYTGDASAAGTDGGTGQSTWPARPGGRGARKARMVTVSAVRDALLIDQLLAAKGIDARDIDGYAHEELPRRGGSDRGRRFSRCRHCNHGCGIAATTWILSPGAGALRLCAASRSLGKRGNADFPAPYRGGTFRSRLEPCLATSRSPSPRSASGRLSWQPPEIPAFDANTAPSSLRFHVRNVTIES